MSIRIDTDYVGLAVYATRDPWADAPPTPAVIVGIVGLGDYTVQFGDGTLATVNEADIWDSLEDYETPK